MKLRVQTNFQLRSGIAATALFGADRRFDVLSASPKALRAPSNPRETLEVGHQPLRRQHNWPIRANPVRTVRSHRSTS
ncbi:hypothetical protein DMH04_41140 [Kibdelosporangium aridum]|uniref:Uncharacterized protein n=1 Tax=Kibdelosporangium aridum TaxID=2030 RepID=A0A428YUM6_KIBAR|nr:hypothetical protein DMH04_41140 [Kibdelosporangium aridum]